MKKILALCVILSSFALAFSPAYGQQDTANPMPPLFSDVDNTHEFYVAIKFLKDQKVITGYPDGTFKPDQTVNRAEALKFILAGTGISVPEQFEDPSFSDVKKDDWFAKFVMHAKSLSVVSGNPDGSFTPGAVVNRAAFMKMLLLAQKFKTAEWKPQREFNDVKSSDWHYPFMTYAGHTGLIREDANKNLLPGKGLSRAEVAEIIYLMTIIRNGDNLTLLMKQTEQHILQIDPLVTAGKLVAAKRVSELAVDMTQQAIKLAPADVTVVGLGKIAKAYDFVLTAFIAGVQKQYDLAKDYALQAIAKANEAVETYDKTKVIADYINSRAQEVLNQIPKP